MNTPAEGKRSTSLNRVDVITGKKKIYYPNLIALCLLAAALVVLSALPVLGQRRNVTTYNATEGLPERHVTAIYQDSTGYIWFGTYSGAVRYNGYRWDTYDNSNGLHNNRIRHIAGDANGRVYLGTHGGVSVFHRGTFSDITIDDGLSGNSINSLYVDTDGTLWIATTNGLNTYAQDGTLATIGPDQGLDALSVTSVYRDSSGTVWIGTANGLYRSQGDGFTNVPIDLKLEKQTVNDIFEDQQGNLLLATDSALLRLTTEGFENYGKQLGIEVDEFYSFSYGPEGNIWVGTFYGLYEIIGQEAILFDEGDGLSDEQTNRLMLDRENNLWIATEDGITKIAPGVFTFYGRSDGLPSDEVFDIVIDSSDNMWVATEDGIAVYDTDMELQTIVDTEDGLDSDLTTALAEGSNGIMYIGTLQSICTWDGQTTRILDNGYSITCLEADSNGRVWIGTAFGLAWISPDDPDFVQRFPADHLLSKHYVNSIAEDTEGRIWVGTNDTGCIVIDGPEIIVFDSSNGFSSQDVWDIAPDPNGGVWIGTNGDGLFRYRNGAFTQITTEDGLNNNFIVQILPDNNGNIWIGTNLGIDRYDGTRFTHLDVYDGLATNEGMPSACVMDSQGRLWFGSRAGLSVTTNMNLGLRPEAGPILIEKVTVGDRTLEAPESIRLGPDDGTLNIHFAALFFRNEGAVRFRYRLMNAEKTWTKPAHVHSVRYAQLPPGSYTFEVEATTDGGHTWSPNPATVSIFIDAPFYQTPAFIGGTLFLLSLAGIITYRSRMAKERRDRQNLEQQVEIRTRDLALANANLQRTNEDLERLNSDLGAFSSSVSHDLRAPLNRIRGYTQLLEDKFTEEHDEESSKYLKRIINDSRRMGELIQDLLKLSIARETILTKEEVNLTFICKEVLSDLRSTENPRDVSVEIETGMVVDGDPRLLRIVIENLLGNAWKFTAERENPLIRISSEKRDGETVICIRDNGIGFDQDRIDQLFTYFGRLHSGEQYRGLGIGLVTVKRIILRHGGQVWAEGIYGEGASFFFSLAREKRDDEKSDSSESNSQTKTPVSTDEM